LRQCGSGDDAKNARDCYTIRHCMPPTCTDKLEQSLR
jgi:hypothetical protein